MGLRSHLKQHWVTWLVSAIFFSPSVYFYLQTREARDPVFIVDPNRTEIISHARVETAPIRVLRHDDRPVTGDVYALRFYFWNAGQTSIRPLHVLDTIRITLDTAGEILDYKILRQSRAIAATRLRADSRTGPLRSLTVLFSILERDDGFTGQIIYQGPREAPLRIAGTIEGVRLGIRDGASPSWMAAIRSSEQIGLLFALLLLGPAIVFGIRSDLAQFRLKRQTLEKDGAPEPERQALDQKIRRSTIAVVVIPIILIVGLGLGSRVAYRSGQEKARLQAVNAVPRAVLP